MAAFQYLFSPAVIHIMRNKHTNQVINIPYESRADPKPFKTSSTCYVFQIRSHVTNQPSREYYKLESKGQKL